MVSDRSEIRSGGEGMMGRALELFTSISRRRDELESRFLNGGSESRLRLWRDVLLLKSESLSRSVKGDA